MSDHAIPLIKTGNETFAGALKNKATRLPSMREARALHPPSSARRSRAPRPAKENPGGRATPLEQGHFAVLIALSMTAVGLFNHFVPMLIATARAKGHQDHVWMLYGASILCNVGGFWYVTRLFQRRLRDLLGSDGRKSFWTGTAVRFAVLSPLFGLQLLGLCLLVRGSNSGKYPRLSFFERTVGFLLSLLVVHAVFLGWELGTKQIKFDRSKRHFVPRRQASVTNAADMELLRLVEERLLPKEWVASFENATIHLLPYLNPSMKMAVAGYLDYAKARAIYEMSADPSLYLCGQEKGCFLTLFSRVSVFDPPLTPMPALFHEMRHRAERQVRRREPQGAIRVPAAGGAAPVDQMRTAEQQIKELDDMFVDALSGLDEMLKLLDPQQPRKSVRQVTAPNGFTLFFGNAEIPFIELVREIQNLSINRLVAEQLKSQLPNLRRSIEEAKDALPQGEHGLLLAKLDELSGRLDRLPQIAFNLNLSGINFNELGL